MLCSRVLQVPPPPCRPALQALACPLCHTLTLLPPPFRLPCSWRLTPAYLSSASTAQLVQLGRLTSLEHRRHVLDPTLLGLHEMITYGLRGLAAYTHHAEVLGYTDREVRL